MNIENLRWNEQGLLPAIVQSSNDLRVLMVAWVNEESLRLTIETGETVFFSRSRQELWHKGASSGNTQKVDSIEVDCDSDAILVKVTENGVACHNGTRSCFDTDSIELNP